MTPIDADGADGAVGETTLAKREVGLARLTEAQERAAELVAEGQSALEAAERVEIDAATLARWRKDPRFVAEVNRRRQDAWGASQDRLRGLMGRAVDALEAAVDRGDVRVAVQVVKAVGVYGTVGAPRGEVDPELIMVRQAEAWAEAEIAKEGPMDLAALILHQDGDRKAQLAQKRLKELRSGGG